MQEIAFLSLRKSKISGGACPQTPPPRSVSVNQKSYTSYAPDSSCNIRICRAQLFKAQFYCNTPTHQESVWIHISVASRSHFVITPSQSKSICPPLHVASRIADLLISVNSLLVAILPFVLFMFCVVL